MAGLPAHTLAFERRLTGRGTACAQALAVELLAGQRVGGDGARATRARVFPCLSSRRSGSRCFERINHARRERERPGLTFSHTSQRQTYPAPFDRQHPHD